MLYRYDENEWIGVRLFYYNFRVKREKIGGDLMYDDVL